MLMLEMKIGWRTKGTRPKARYHMCMLYLQAKSPTHEGGGHEEVREGRDQSDPARKSATWQRMVQPRRRKRKR